MTFNPILIRRFLLLAVLCFAGIRATALPQGAGLPRQARTVEAYRIAGTVVSSLDAHPLPRARITVRDAKDPQKFQFVITSENGKFEFTGLPVGKYSLSGARRGFIAAAYDQHDQFSTAIVTGAGLDTETLVLRLAPDAVISGRVLDEAGEPVRQALVTLYYNDHTAGLDRVRAFHGAQTDDQGTYEITALRPGTYFLSASAKPWYAVHPSIDPPNIEPPNIEPPESGPDGHENKSAPIADRLSADRALADRALDVAYPVTLYADVTDAESATPIPVRGGDHLQVDIHLNPVPALRLLFHVADDGKHGFNVPQFQQPAFDGFTFVNIAGANMVSPGILQVTGIPAGHYNIRIPDSEAAVQMNAMNLSKDGEEIDTSTAESLSSVKVSVQLPDESSVPTRLMVGLRSGRKVAATWQNIDAKGEAKFEQIASGNYELLVQAPDKRYSIVHMSVQGSQVSGHMLSVAAGSSPSVSLTLVGGDVDIQGTVKKAGKGFAGAMVVLVPENPENDHDLFRRDQSDLDGTFKMSGVIPGAYTLLAIENGWDLDWSQPGVIAAYLKHGRKIQVGARAGRTMDIAEAIEVQSK